MFIVVLIVGVATTGCLITAYKFMIEPTMIPPPGFLTNVTASELHSFLEESCKCIPIFDVRVPFEYVAGHLNGSRNIPYPDTGFLQHFEYYNKSRPIVVYGDDGARSWNACADLYNYGFLYIYNLQDGYASWEQKGYPVIHE